MDVKHVKMTKKERCAMYLRSLAGNMGFRAIIEGHVLSIDEKTEIKKEADILVAIAVLLEK